MLQEREVLAHLVTTKEFLDSQASLTLDERVAKLKNTYPDASVTRHWLRKQYDKARIKKKKIVTRKRACPASLSMEMDAYLDLMPKLRMYTAQGRRIIYMDEIYFGSWTLPSTE